ncbi:MAG: acyl-CoA dehydrogenase [Gammaproteobacteria bacterium]|nr:acyl-CoA dehydrogenase [Gammaproteobacteria bacterium]
MSEELSLLTQTAGRIMSEQCTPELIELAEAGEKPSALWETLEGAGLTTAGLSEAAGGVGGEPAWGVAVMIEAGRYAVPLPLAETWLAGRVLEASSQVLPGGMTSVVAGEFSLADGRVRGHAADVSFAGWAEHVVLVGATFVALVAADAVDVTPVATITGEPAGDIVVDAEPVSVANAAAGEVLLTEGAVLRSAMMAGALEFMLESGVAFAEGRTQFGRPIAKFQAIQHQLAVMAGDVAAARRAADLAASALGTSRLVGLAAAAKARCGEAAGACSDIAHQVHGAMGYTREHPLNLRSRRLWRWRDDYGHEVFWQERLGAAALERGADGVWGFLTDLA